MAYRRPLTARQSQIIILLWLIFVLLYLYHVPLSGSGVVMLIFSAFIVFYPILKSYRERREK